jgi:transposase InsO family protein
MAYGFVYKTSSERADMPRDWIHHYNWHRPHRGIGGKAPMSSLNRSK